MEEEKIKYNFKLNSKTSIATIAVIATILFFPLSAAPTIAVDESGVPEKLVVGTMVLPPFAMKKPSGEWEGLSIELLQAVAEDLETDFELREYSSIGQYEDAIENGEIDLVLMISMRENFELIADFSNPYYRSGSAIVVNVGGEGHGWFRVAERLVSTNFLTVIGLLVLLWFIAGSLVWLFESRRNSEMFGDKIVKGLGHGIWWAVVTMTTVGYGDKAPKTFGGRFVATLWMFTSIILISSFTAAITTSLTVDELKGKVRGFQDLPFIRVGGLADSQSLEQLIENGIAAIPFKSTQDGLRAVAENRINAFIFDEAILKHLVKTEYPDQLRVLAETLNHYYIGMAVPPSSPLLEQLNRALLRVMNKEEWDRLVVKYLGSGS
jgi:polar amino acid transport system substrate-binding protein